MVAMLKAAWGETMIAKPINPTAAMTYPTGMDAASNISSNVNPINAPLPGVMA